MAAITVEGLKKRYGATEAVRGVDFEVGVGETLCILGPNGAGKTTTVEIVEGFRRPDAGTVRVLGHDPAKGERALLDRIGIVLQSQGVTKGLKVREALAMHAGWYERPRDVEQTLELVELADDADTMVGALSGGRRRRLDLALGLIGDPDILFLDEPTTGFDPHARRQAWSLVRGLCAEGRTVILTTHFMDEAQALADRIAVMRDGLIVAEGTPDELTGRDRAVRISYRLPGGERKVVETTTPTRTAHELTGWALEQGIELEGLEIARPSLEDVYLTLTEEEAA